MYIRLFAVALLVAGCASEPDSDTEPVAVPSTADPAEIPLEDESIESDIAAALALEAEGLRVVAPSGSATPLAFGTVFEVVLEAVTRLRGEPSDQGVSPECGAGPLDYASWADGLTVYGQNGEFAGWAVDGDAPGVETLTTMAGLGIGSARSDLEDAYGAEVMETTLGTEFSAGELFGILSGPGPDATVDALWGGVYCNFR